MPNAATRFPSCSSYPVLSFNCMFNCSIISSTSKHLRYQCRLHPPTSTPRRGRGPHSQYGLAGDIRPTTPGRSNPKEDDSTCPWLRIFQLDKMLKDGAVERGSGKAAKQINIEDFSETHTKYSKRNRKRSQTSTGQKLH